MKLHELNHRPDIENHKLNDIISQFNKMLIELEKREIPDEIVITINKDIDEINSITNIGNKMKIQIKKKLQRIIKLLERNLKLVPINYYRNMWMALGMAVFGIPIGFAFGLSLGNMTYLAIGLPVGLAIGIGVGDRMDKHALKEGRQINIEVKF